MADNQDNKDFLTKADFQVFLTSFEQKLTDSRTAERAELLKEFDTRENKIHSSYVNKMKKLGISEDDGTSTDPKPTKRELELQDQLRKASENTEKLLSKFEEKDKLLAQKDQEKALLAHKNSFTETLVKGGFDIRQAEVIHKLQQVDNAFVDDGKGGFNWKVKANGVDVALPLDQAVKYFAKSELAQTFLPSKTEGGGTKNPNPTNNEKPSSGRKNLEVDWFSVSKDQGGNGGEGDTAPPFNYR